MVDDGRRRFAEREQLSGIVREVFGADCRLNAVERLRGGSKKGVYRLSFGDGLSAVLYAWSADEDFWPAGSQGGEADPFSHASGLRLFEAGQARLSSLGVRVPELYFADRSRKHHPEADIALIEDVRGGTLETLLRDDPVEGERVLDRLAAGLAAMGRDRARHLGKVASVEDGMAPQGRSSVEVVLERALKDLGEAAGRVERIDQAREGFERALRGMAAVVEPREDYGLIHGELGPDHVLVNDQGEPVLIDIEGTMFFDVEWEHVFMQFRFHEFYERLRIDGLDERRMRLYRLAQHLSLVAGPLRLLDGDFPDREFMIGIAKGHTEGALRFLRDYRTP
ncbi:phosphotransferase [Nonomuraea basaltis]|uniref:phosphotransferase n=1 Tax=Nonomuraea basaltis TaxID=2495887 RepID=UPI00110C484F|nr:phosphotransferase [Nonomuraea basaltis]TMR99081.1 aminoglycoside phosphotransferase family protein [Nonomuraea basaltis]